MDDHTPRVFRSKSFELKQQLVRNEVKKAWGCRERSGAWRSEIARPGRVHNGLSHSRSGAYYCQVQGQGQFALQMLGASRKSQCTAHLSPVGDLHYPPNRKSHVEAHLPGSKPGR